MKHLLQGLNGVDALKVPAYQISTQLSNARLSYWWFN